MAKGLSVSASSGTPSVTARLKAPTLKVQASAGIPEVEANLSPPKREPPKRGWQRFMDLNWKTGKPVLKEVAREAIVEFVKWLLARRCFRYGEQRL